MFNFMRKRLTVKLFLSYLFVIIAGMGVLVGLIDLTLPVSYTRHSDEMRMFMSNDEGGMMMGGIQILGQRMMLDRFYKVLNSTVFEAVILSILAAFGVAVLVSGFISRMVVQPVQRITEVAHRIAEGHYHERVHVAEKTTPENQDELGRLAVSFNQMASSLEQTESLRQQLIGDVAHELRTPLAVIKGSMEGLMDGVLPADSETYLHIYQEADRLQRIVSDLQELSRVEGGAFTLNRRPVPPGRLVETVVRRLGRQFEEKGVALETAVGAGLPDLLLDEDRMGQVMMNLVGNALQYTPEGGRVWVKVHAEPGSVPGVRFEVIDNGIGVSAEHLPHLFDRFYRVDKSRSRAHGGSGIGLTIAYHMVEAHGGVLKVSSPGEGLGSTFWFVLPVESL